MRFFHRHRWRERFGGLRSDEPGGPRTIHEIWWECECGAVMDARAKARAEAVDGRSRAEAEANDERPE